MGGSTARTQSQTSYMTSWWRRTEGQEGRVLWQGVRVQLVQVSARFSKHDDRHGNVCVSDCKQMQDDVAHLGPSSSNFFFSGSGNISTFSYI